MSFEGKKASGREQSIKELFIHTCWSYLRDNFHKFNQTNQIKVALELVKKDLPDKTDGSSPAVVIMGEIKRGGVPVRFNVGTDVTADSPDTGEAVSSN